MTDDLDIPAEAWDHFDDPSFDPVPPGHGERGEFPNEPYCACGRPLSMSEGRPQCACGRPTTDEEER